LSKRSVDRFQISDEFGFASETSPSSVSPQTSEKAVCENLETWKPENLKTWKWNRGPFTEGLGVINDSPSPSNQVVEVVNRGHLRKVRGYFLQIKSLNHCRQYRHQGAR
jgi:hypothetical protein